MAVFDTYGRDRINDLLNKRFEEMLRLQPCELTAKHFVDAFVKPGHRDTLIAAKGLVQQTSDVSWLKLDTHLGGENETLRAEISVRHLPCLIPAYMEPLRLDRYMPENDAADAVLAWAYDAHDLIRQIVALKCCLAYLNDACSDAVQIAAFLPALVPHLTAAEDSDKDLPENKHTFQSGDGRIAKRDFSAFTKARKRLISGRAAKTLPQAPRIFINECRAANTLLLRCALTLEAGAQTSDNSVVRAAPQLISTVKAPAMFGGKPKQAGIWPSYLELTLQTSDRRIQ